MESYIAAEAVVIVEASLLSASTDFRILEHIHPILGGVIDPNTRGLV